MASSESTLLSPATADACRHRQQKLAAAIQELSLDVLLVSAEKDIQYLTGFVGHDSLLLVNAGGEAAILSDPRYDEYLNPWREANATEIVMGKRHRLNETVRQMCDTRGWKKVGIQAEHTTIAGRAKLVSAIGESRLAETIGIVNSLRMKKDDVEIAAIEKALDIQQQALTATLDQLTIGMTELEFSALLEYEMKMRGSGGAGFTPIIGAGSNSSIIHHSTGHSPVREGVLLIDWGATFDGYCGDLTRTYGIGDMPKKIREIYPIVLEAQMAAIAAIAPGKICAEIDAVARNIISKAGYGEYFGHGLGHGLGMDVHETPYFNDLETATKLEPGMVMTVEPGIYLPGIGGVRIEDDVLITGNGHRVLSNYPKDLSSATIQPARSNNQSRRQTAKV